MIFFGLCLLHWILAIPGDIPTIRSMEFRKQVPLQAYIIAQESCPGSMQPYISSGSEMPSSHLFVVIVLQ